MPETIDVPASRWRRPGVVLVIASFVGIWGYVMYLSIFVGRAEPIDRLDDTDFVQTAEATCAPSRALIDELPLASEVDSATERADVLDRATDELEIMLVRLAALIPPADAEEAEAVDEWLVDWQTYLGNRRAYAERFRAGIDEPFRVTDRGGFQIDVRIDDFAHINYMDSCATPDDVG